MTTYLDRSMISAGEPEAERRTASRARTEELIAG